MGACAQQQAAARKVKRIRTLVLSLPFCAAARCSRARALRRRLSRLSFTADIRLAAAAAAAARLLARRRHSAAKGKRRRVRAPPQGAALELLLLREVEQPRARGRLCAYRGGLADGKLVQDVLVWGCVL